MTLSHFTDIDRREALYLLIKMFLVRSVVMHGAIPDDLDRIDALLCGCIRDRALVAELEVWYLSTPADAELVEKEGQALFRIDWDAHGLEATSGRCRFRVSEEDPLGSLSPVYARLADEIRRSCIRDRVRELFWSVRWVDGVYGSPELQARLRRQHRIDREYGRRMLAAEKAYRASARVLVSAQIAAVAEGHLETTWRQHARP
jgi:hypothetical protein